MSTSMQHYTPMQQPPSFLNSIKWNCATCKVLNDPPADKCAGCQTPRSSSWKCDACWVQNGGHLASCSACETPRYADKAATSMTFGGNSSADSPPMMPAIFGLPDTPSGVFNKAGFSPNGGFLPSSVNGAGFTPSGGLMFSTSQSTPTNQAQSGGFFPSQTPNHSGSSMSIDSDVESSSMSISTATVAQSAGFFPSFGSSQKRHRNFEEQENSISAEEMKRHRRLSVSPTPSTAQNLGTEMHKSPLLQPSSPALQRTPHPDPITSSSESSNSMSDNQRTPLQTDEGSTAEMVASISSDLAPGLAAASAPHLTRPPTDMDVHKGARYSFGAAPPCLTPDPHSMFRATPTFGSTAGRDPSIDSTSCVPLNKPDGDKLNEAAGIVYTWGSGDCDQLALSSALLNDLGYAPSPLPIIKLRKQIVVAISCGALHSAALLGDGTVVSWGCNDDFCLGRPTTDGTGTERTPARVVGLPESDPVVTISTGDSHTAAITANGHCFAWGSYKDNSGFIGFPNFKSGSGSIDGYKAKTPTQIEGLTGHAVKLASGENHTVILCVPDEGAPSPVLYSWGSGEFGQLLIPPLPDNTDTTPYLFPQMLTANSLGLSGHVTNVYCGRCSTFIEMRDTSTKYYAAGRGSCGELGVGKSVDGLHKIEEIEEFAGKEIACLSGGQFSSIAVDADGAVFTWGKREYLGQRFPENQLKPQRLPTLNEVVRVGAGGDTFFAITKTGTLYSWGEGQMFQIGDGNEYIDPVTNPTFISPTNFDNSVVLEASGGSQHSLALVFNGNYSESKSLLTPAPSDIKSAIPLPFPRCASFGQRLLEFVMHAKREQPSARPKRPRPHDLIEVFESGAVQPVQKRGRVGDSPAAVTSDVEMADVEMTDVLPTHDERASNEKGESEGESEKGEKPGRKTRKQKSESEAEESEKEEKPAKRTTRKQKSASEAEESEKEEKPAKKTTRRHKSETEEEESEKEEKPAKKSTRKQKSASEAEESEKEENVAKKTTRRRPPIPKARVTRQRAKPVVDLAESDEEMEDVEVKKPRKAQTKTKVESSRATSPKVEPTRTSRSRSKAPVEEAAEKTTRPKALAKKKATAEPAPKAAPKRSARTKAASSEEPAKPTEDAKRTRKTTKETEEKLGDPSSDEKKTRRGVRGRAESEEKKKAEPTKSKSQKDSKKKEEEKKKPVTRKEVRKAEPKKPAEKKSIKQHIVSLDSDESSTEEAKPKRQARAKESASKVNKEVIRTARTRSQK